MGNGEMFNKNGKIRITEYIKEIYYSYLEFRKDHGILYSINIAISLVNEYRIKFNRKEE